MIDTHAHLYSEKFEGEYEAMLSRAFSEGVQRIYMPNIDLDSIDGMLRLAELFPNKCMPMMGLHPCYVGPNYRDDLQSMRQWFDKRKFAAVGEIGTDLYWDKSHFDRQQEAFIIQCKWALELNLPIIVHCRESFWETIDLLEEFRGSSIKGIFHCFTGGEREAQAVIDLGFLMGIGGVVTYKNGGLDVVLPNVPIEHIVLETDSPYLAPNPFRGKRNESAYIKHIALKLAEIKKLPIEVVIAETTANALKLFHGSE